MAPWWPLESRLTASGEREWGQVAQMAGAVHRGPPGPIIPEVYTSVMVIPRCSSDIWLLAMNRAMTK
jgi:hypothetical protein